ncbi:MAG TPA: DedA family protein [Anaeromyxobacter sp.]|nr:DedA family protein [Anaeromyxobacter sp.]
MLEQLVQMGGQTLQFGCAFVFLALLLCGFGLPMPEDIILVSGGIIAWKASPIRELADHPSLRAMLGDPGLLAMVAAGLAGILAGDLVIFLAGRRFGSRVADFRPLRRIVPPAKLEQVEKLMRRRGDLVVVIARFLPGLRAPTYFTAGHARMPVWEFLLLDGLAALVSAPVWVCLGFYFGSDIEAAARKATEFGHYIMAAVGVVLLALAARWLHVRRTRARAAADAAAANELAAEPPSARSRASGGAPEP